MKKSPLNSHADDLISQHPQPIGLNTMFSPPTPIPNHNYLAASPPPAPLSDHQTARRPESRTPSFSTSASSLSCSPSSYESPLHCLITPSSAVPFSWERRPGIPKIPDTAAAAAGADKEAKFLPPPPPLRSAVGHSRRTRSDGGEDDPFVAALSQCAKDGTTSDDDMDAVRWRRSAGKTVGIWRRAVFSDRIGLVRLYGSCKTACCVSDAIIGLPRANRRAAGSYGRMNRRPE